ncbi:MAG: hypothetical protein HPY44_04540 [Armatimonadetes bacterium]|nr:hypothetical protein [Armatimonadota bacterium]
MNVTRGWRVRAFVGVLLTLSPCASPQDAELTATISAGFEDFAATLGMSTLAETAAHAGNEPIAALRLQSPIDHGYGFGASALYCPSFLPDLYPGANLGQMCEEDFYSSPWFTQRWRFNPFVIARDQVELLASDADERGRRLAWAAAYAYLNRGTDEWASDSLLSLLKDSSYLKDDVIADFAGSVLLPRLPEELTEISPPEGQIAVDLRVLSNISYDSVASVERMIREAARKGLKAIAVADRSRIDGWQKAQRIAARLQREREIPPDFLVIPGQVVYTHSGPVLALFTTDHIPDGMTMKRVIETIHEEDGLAFMLHPGVTGGPERLLKFDFDGYVIQPIMFEMFRVLSLLNDPRYEDRLPITISQSPYARLAGQPYTLVETDEVSLPAIKRALKEHKAYAAGEVYLPWMTVASYPPLAKFSRFLNRYYVLHSWAETRIARAIGADSLMFSTSWDREVRSMIGLAKMPDGVRDLFDGSSPLLEDPQLLWVAAEYGPFRLGYDDRIDQAFLQARWTW